ncbi:MAG: ribose ABC transporter [Proteobacteria bacterium]|nr:ribose ABC transporter [Pseudomonadota bacterium]
MLKTIDPILNADLLHALAAMGHGDDIVIADANFPADAVARATTLGHALRLDGVGAARAARAILSLMPLDTFVDAPARRMEVVGQPGEMPEVQHEVAREIAAAEGRPVALAPIERHAFYEAAKSAYCVVATGERRFYGCFILKKGVIPPSE